MNIKNLETQYLKAKVAYYEGHPIMTDAAFDMIEKELKAAGSKVVEQVGAKRKDFDFPHPNRMRSLAKFQTESVNGVTNYQEEEFEAWMTKRVFQINRTGETVKKMHYAPKFDGSAINIIYKEGNFESVLTRGDGKAGKDVSDRFRKYLPSSINQKGTVEIRCEAVMAFKKFEAINKEREKLGEVLYANARNLVAGIIGKDDFDIKKIEDIKLIPVHYLINGRHQDIDDVHFIIPDSKILSPLYYAGTCPTSKEYYVRIVKEMETLRETFDYPLDGVVFSFPPEFRELLGENDHDPNWSIAIKFVPEESVTTVVGIEWNLGKTGELIPVVIVKPVQLAGTTVKRASGYNAGYIIKNKIQPGTIVSLCKRGDIIPAIQEVITSNE